MVGTLLPKLYDIHKAHVREVIHQEEFINLVMDESTDVAHNRIINLCVATSKGAFYWETRDSGSNAQTAEFLTNWLVERVDALMGGDWSRINSISTDTCNTMRAVWQNLRCLPSRKHIFCIPCDSHGLQLLIKDILSISPYDRLVEKAETIASWFHRSHLQLKILQDHQEPKRAFILSVITRWGTQSAMVAAVLDNRRPLKAYLDDPRAECAPDVRSIIEDTAFWAVLEDLGALLHGISKRQKASEGEQAHVGMVRKRWDEIRLHLESSLRFGLFKTNQQAAARILPAFDRRRNVQSVALHTVAFFLDSANFAAHLSVEENNIVDEFLTEYGNDQARHQYIDYRSQSGQSSSIALLIGPGLLFAGNFTRQNRVWLHASDAVAFWRGMKPFAPQLSSLCLRLFHALANSVPSERAFSSRNLVHSVLRNRLGAERADQLCFVHINRRILQRYVILFLQALALANIKLALPQRPVVCTRCPHASSMSWKRRF
jgi:hypothetical protein